MNEHIIISLYVAIVAAIMASCQPQQKENGAISASKETVVSKRIKLGESSYADGVLFEHALELFRAKGGGKMGDINGLPKSRLAIIPGTTHIGMIQRTDWLITTTFITLS